MQLVVPSAVKNAVSAATITFTASSITLCFFMIRFALGSYQELMGVIGSYRTLLLTLILPIEVLSVNFTSVSELTSF